MTKRIILFASGNGSNVENICRFFQKNQKVTIVGVFTNNPIAGVIKRVSQFELKPQVFDKKDFTNGKLLSQVVSLNPDLIILAGFLWRISANWLSNFPRRIINIHPALLPKYGGKGMYGKNVHRAVKTNEEKETGITIHYVSEHYDEGAIIIQKKVSISEGDSEIQIAAKVHALELRYFPNIIDQLLTDRSDEV